MNKEAIFRLTRQVLVLSALTVSVGIGFAQKAGPANPRTVPSAQAKGGTRCTTMRCITNADRVAAAKRAAALRSPAPAARKISANVQSLARKLNVSANIPLVSGCASPVMNAGGVPDYMSGCVGNYANSPLPTVSGTISQYGSVTGTVSGGIRKFIDPLPSIPVAVPDKFRYPGSDYYEISLIEVSQQLHSDLPPTLLRMYVQTNNGMDASGGNIVSPPPARYLGPLIVAQKDVPVRVKFTNKLSSGAGGNLFLPVDTTIMGAGMGPDGTVYTQNRSGMHLHGGNTPWISDGTPHQWTVPVGETASLSRGLSTQDVPDMPATGLGEMTFYYTNQQSARLMFYHDHTYGITRLNVYAGVAAGYLLQDSTEAILVNGGTITPPVGGAVTVLPGTIPADQIPLIIQDKTFIPPADQLAAQDPTWNWGPRDANGNFLVGNLWFPHVYMTNQNPSDDSGVNAMGRWDWGPWFWPAMDPSTLLPQAAQRACPTTSNPGQMCPGTPQPSLVPEAFMDTPVVNGAAYPVLTVKPQAYRFRILNASNDRSLNLTLYQATVDSTPTAALCSGLPAAPAAGNVASCTEVRQIPAPDGIASQGPIPDPLTKGPNMIQIGSEGGFIPNPVTLTNQPIVYNYNRRDIVVLNVQNKNLWLGPAERGDVIVDFSQFAGKTLILYNDSPAPAPAFDTRYDFYTGDMDQTAQGGAPQTIVGYGPNTRTIMQIQVSGGTPVPFNAAALATALPVAFAASQPAPIIPEPDYNTAYAATFPTTYGRIQDTSLFTGSLTGFLVTTGGSGYTAPPTVFIAAPATGGTQATATAVLTAGVVTGITVTNPGARYYSTPVINITNAVGDTTGRSAVALAVGVPMLRKTIQELFELDYGRMNATLGTELPFSSFLTQTTVPLGYIDPPTESFIDGQPQIWKITHNGVDTHSIHFHLFNVQVINRVGWDGAVRAPDPNEIGWKETVKMSPLEDVIVAFLPLKQTLPFPLPDSIRPEDVTAQVGATIRLQDLVGSATPQYIPNPLLNFGQEYVWHCHLLGHEENDMMRPMIFLVPPEAPSDLVALGQSSGSDVVLTWVDHSATETGFEVERDIDPQFTSPTKFTAGASSASNAKGQGTGSGSTITLTDSTGGTVCSGPSCTVYYQVRAVNAAAFNGYSAAGALQTQILSSPWSNIAVVGLAPSATVSPSSLVFTGQAIGSTSAAQVVTVANAGPGSLIVGGVAIAGTNSGDFSQTNTCTTIINAGSSCLINVAFAPTLEGARAGNLVFTTNDPANPQFSVALSGTGLAAVLTLAPTALSFGNQPVNTTSAPPLTITVSNATGTAPLLLNGIDITGTNASDFSLTQSCGTVPVNLPAGATCIVSLSFSPTAAGARSASLAVTAAAPATSMSAALSGNGTAPNPSLLPSSLLFANQVVNTASIGQTVTLSNTGLAPLANISFSVAGLNPADYAQTTTCPTTLGANSTCTVSVTFKPLTRGLRTATLVVTDGVPTASTQTVSLSGTGIAPVIGVQPVPLAFGVQVLTTTSATQSLVISNTGDAPLLFSGVAIGINASDYSLVANNCGAALPALMSCTVDVTFTPTFSGVSSGAVVIASSDPFNPQLSVPIGGIGTALAVSPSTLAFASQTVGTSTASRVVTLTNAGPTTLSISSIVLAGVDVIDFTLNDGCGTSLRSGRACTVSLRFMPTAIGARSASLEISTSDVGVPKASVVLSGTGLAAALSTSPAALTFTSALRTPSASQLVTVTNSGNGPLTINGINLSGTNPGQFIQNNTCPLGTTLAVGATCTISVTFSPNSATPLVMSQTLNINVAAPATSQTIPLTGTVITPTYSVSAAPLAFGSQAINTTSPSQAVIVTNTGTVPLTLTNIAIGGSNRFAQTSNCGTSSVFRPFPATLVAGATCTINVTFRPRTAITSNGTLSVSVGGGATPAQTQVALSGAGQ